ncbi:MAG: hypothetical protein IT209_01580 [Armatimonadetes bacterium]|nr:hypothetical protein [Armatimonadota bacterium]
MPEPPTDHLAKIQHCGAERASAADCESDLKIEVGDSGRHGGVSARAVLTSLALIVAMCWWITYSEVRTGTTEITCTALPIGAIFALFVVCSLNAFVQSVRPAAAFKPGELATIYILTAVGSSVAGIGMIGFLTPALANPLWFPFDHWKEMADAVPWSWAPRDQEAIRAFYVGNSTLYTWAHIRAWIPPLLVWGGFLLLILFMMLCFAAILRRQWIENERLTFPITYVPVAMTMSPGGFGELMRGRAMLIGFLIPVVLQSINSLNWLFPQIPAIPLKPTAGGPLDLGPFFRTPPWNALGYFPLAFHPNTIGLSYILTTDVSFSCWFFYLVRKFSEVWCVALGWRTGSGSSAFARMPFSSEQGVGAWLALAALALWIARKHLAAVWRGAMRPSEANDADEGMSYRTAVFGAIACFAGAIAFACWGGLPLIASALLFGIFGAYMLALTRIRAEVGTAWNFGPWVNPPEMVVRTLGPMNFSTHALAALAYHGWYNMDYRSMTAPHLFEGYKIGEQGRLRTRRLTLAMVAAVVVGILCASWTVLHLYYTYGAGTAKVNPWRIEMGQIPYTRAASHILERDVGPDFPGLTAAGVGAAITVLLSIARTQFVSWPFHPAGYAVANTYITDLLWFPFFLGWLAKLLTLKFGGMKFYRKALPFFIGLILGDYVIASLWTFVGIILNSDMYRCFPN